MSREYVRDLLGEERGPVSLTLRQRVTTTDIFETAHDVTVSRQDDGVWLTICARGSLTGAQFVELTPDQARYVAQLLLAAADAA